MNESRATEVQELTIQVNALEGANEANRALTNQVDHLKSIQVHLLKLFNLLDTNYCSLLQITTNIGTYAFLMANCEPIHLT
ncbi:hypothetical protein CPC16_000753 [Podila verticillata]|nr:hypothetical protein CPC16_000753 [Podila verticillata]